MRRCFLAVLIPMTPNPSFPHEGPPIRPCEAGLRDILVYVLGCKHLQPPGQWDTWLYIMGGEGGGGLVYRRDLSNRNMQI